jgi:hypothetical protein
MEGDDTGNEAKNENVWPTQHLFTNAKQAPNEGGGCKEIDITGKPGDKIKSN